MSSRDLGAGPNSLVDRQRDKAAKNQIRSSQAPKFYAIAQVAEMLDVSTRTVRRWVARGEVVVHRFGGTVRVAEADLRTFLALHRED